MRDLRANGSTGESLDQTRLWAARPSPVVGRKPRGEGGDLGESVGRSVRQLIKIPPRRLSRLVAEGATGRAL